MLESFYDIKPLEEWLDPDNGLIYQNNESFSTLNVVPSSFGHTLVIPKRIVYKATDMTPEELWLFYEALEKTKNEISGLANDNTERILDLYRKWIEDDDLNGKLPARERLSVVMKDIEDGNIQGFTDFRNYGENAGQMVRQYHEQIVPRFQKGLKGGGESLFKYLHQTE